VAAITYDMTVAKRLNNVLIIKSKVPDEQTSTYFRLVCFSALRYDNVLPQKTSQVLGKKYENWMKKNCG
jgi:hypothetical protein